MAQPDVQSPLDLHTHQEWQNADLHFKLSQANGEIPLDLTATEVASLVNGILNRLDDHTEAESRILIAKVIAGREKTPRLADFAAKLPSNDDNLGRVSNGRQGDAVDALRNRRIDAIWALDAWKNRRSSPELQKYVGQFVAVFGEQIIASGDDFDDVLKDALAISGTADESDILVDYWGEDGTFHPTTEE